MELKDGYKYTEVGVIPVDWEVKRIGNLCQIFGRIGFRGYTINDIVEEGQGAITISPSNIQNNKMDFTKCTYISWYKYEESPEIKIFNGDILLVKTGSTSGKTAIIRDLKECATINPQIVVLKRIVVDNFFLGYVMGYELVQNQITSFIVGGAIPTLSQKQIAGFQIPIPPTLAEQTAIAKALSDTDALISSLEQVIEKKRCIKQGAMQALLSPKDGWEVKLLEDLGDVTSGKRLPLGQTLTNEETPHPYIRVTDMYKGGVNTSNIMYVPENVFPLIKNYRIYKNEIFISVAGTLGIVGFIPDILDGANLTENANKISNIACDKGYLLYVLMSSQIQSIIEAERTLGAQPKLALTRIRKFPIPIPPTLTEQTRIATILSDMDEELRGLEGKLEKLKGIKQGMMQNLLTGKIRLV